MQFKTILPGIVLILSIGGCNNVTDSSHASGWGSLTATSISELERFQSTDQPSIFVTVSPTPATAPIKSLVGGVQYEGGEALRVDYSLPANGFLEISRARGASNVFAAFNPTDFISLKLSSATTNVLPQTALGSSRVVKLDLYEDNNQDGVYETGADEVWESPAQSKPTNFDGTMLFRPVAGTGNFSEIAVNAPQGDNQINYNRIGKWRVRVINTTSSALSAQNVVVDLLRREPSALSGTFVQIDGARTQAQWDALLKEMIRGCQDTLIVQYTRFVDGNGIESNWYTGSNEIGKAMTAASNITNAVRSNNTGQWARFQFKVVLGLYFNQNWEGSQTDPKYDSSSLFNTTRSQQQTTMNALNALGYPSQAAFGGWYIPQEVDNYRWLSSNTTRLNLLGTYLNQVSSDLKTLTPRKKVYTAPFFSRIVGTDSATNYASTWTNLFNAAPGLDAILVQDGLGVKSRGSSNNTVADVTNFYTALATTAKNANREFGADLESFRENGARVPAKWTVVAADPTNLKPGFREAIDLVAAITPQQVHFEQRYMLDSSTAATALRNGYKGFITTAPSSSTGASCAPPTVP
jgi:Domain of unknown function (DUF4434)